MWIERVFALKESSVIPSTSASFLCSEINDNNRFSAKESQDFFVMPGLLPSPDSMHEHQSVAIFSVYVPVEHDCIKKNNDAYKGNNNKYRINVTF